MPSESFDEVLPRPDLRRLKPAAAAWRASPRLHRRAGASLGATCDPPKAGRSSFARFAWIAHAHDLARSAAWPRGRVTRARSDARRRMPRRNSIDLGELRRAADAVAFDAALRRRVPACAVEIASPAPRCLSRRKLCGALLDDGARQPAACAPPACRGAARTGNTCRKVSPQSSTSSASSRTSSSVSVGKPAIRSAPNTMSGRSRRTSSQNATASARQWRRFMRFRVMSSPACSERCRCGISRSSSAIARIRSASASTESIEESRSRGSSGTSLQDLAHELAERHLARKVARRKR